MTRAKEILEELKKIDKSTYVDTDPDPELVKLLKQGADGGKGEFDPFIPKKLARSSTKFDTTWEPVLRSDKKTVEWVQTK